MVSFLRSSVHDNFPLQDTKLLECVLGSRPANLLSTSNIEQLEEISIPLLNSAREIPSSPRSCLYHIVSIMSIMSTQSRQVDSLLRM